MVIGVISDTHIPERADKIPGEVLKIFKGVDLIIHAGDLTSLNVLDVLGRIAQVKAVHGNMDHQEVVCNLPEKQVVKIGNFSIGIIHGRGHPDHLLDFVAKQFKENVDAVIFGHSHKPFNEKRGGILFFNPGSPTDKAFSPYNSCGILKIDSSIEGKIIKFNDTSHG